MKKILVWLFSFSQAIAFAQRGIVYYKPQDAQSRAASIPKSLFQSDIGFWQKVMEESHVNLYHAISKEQVNHLSDSLLGLLPHTVSQQQALFVIGYLAASLNEGHIYLPSSPTTDSLYLNHSVRFPFTITNVDDIGNLVVGTDWSSEQKLAKGSKVVAVNGVSSKELYNKYRNFFGGLERWRQQMVATYCRKLFFLDGMQGPFSITAINPDGDTLKYKVNGLNKLQIDSLNKVVGQTVTKASQQPFSFEILDGNIGLIQFNSMNGSLAEKFKLFLDSSFAVIKQKKCIGLVIDIRQNGGGDSQLGETLISYIASKPYRMGGGMKWKVSSHYKEYLRITGSKDEDYIGRVDGEVFEYIDPPLKRPQANANKYSGHVALLIGPNTFSSANMLADGISTYHLAKVFGEPSGECGNDYGEMFNFMLPNTHIVARSSTKMFIRASGDETDFRPTLPDVEVKFTGSKTNEDMVLKAAVNWLQNH